MKGKIDQYLIIKYCVIFHRYFENHTILAKRYIVKRYAEGWARLTARTDGPPNGPDGWPAKRPGRPALRPYLITNLCFVYNVLGVGILSGHFINIFVCTKKHI